MDETSPTTPTTGGNGGGDRHNDAPMRAGAASGGQWDRFEVQLSKPSGKQKLGMVLKHVQVGLSHCTVHVCAVSVCTAG